MARFIQNGAVKVLFLAQNKIILSLRNKSKVWQYHPG